MYIKKSLIEGLKILSFDKETIKDVSREKSLEEIFLSTLFLNYLLVLIVYLLGLAMGGFTFQEKSVNMPVFFSLLMIYPFAFNLIIYVIYGFFGLTSEMIDSKNRVKPLMSVGYHVAIVYSFLIFIIAALSAKLGSAYGLFVLSVFLAWFIYTMFISLSTVYKFSLPQTLIVLFIPFLVIGLIILLIGVIAPEIISNIFSKLFI